jgi:uncharacterized protein (DUF2141 family)
MFRSLPPATLALALIAAAAPAGAAPAAGAQLTVRFTGLHPATGYVMAAVYASEDSFSGKGAPVQAARVAVTGDSVETRFDLPAGHYAIKAFQDADADGKMGVNPFGIPTEPYGASNNAVGHMGPPAWKDAGFDIGPGAPALQTIAMH